MGEFIRNLLAVGGCDVRGLTHTHRQAGVAGVPRGVDDVLVVALDRRLTDQLVVGIDLAPLATEVPIGIARRLRGCDSLRLLRGLVLGGLDGRACGSGLTLLGLRDRNGSSRIRADLHPVTGRIRAGGQHADGPLTGLAKILAHVIGRHPGRQEGGRAAGADRGNRDFGPVRVVKPNVVSHTGLQLHGPTHRVPAIRLAHDARVRNERPIAVLRLGRLVDGVTHPLGDLLAEASDVATRGRDDRRGRLRLLRDRRGGDHGGLLAHRGNRAAELRELLGNRRGRRRDPPLVRIHRACHRGQADGAGLGQHRREHHGRPGQEGQEDDPDQQAEEPVHPGGLGRDVEPSAPAREVASHPAGNRDADRQCDQQEHREVDPKPDVHLVPPFGVRDTRAVGDLPLTLSIPPHRRTRTFHSHQSLLRFPCQRQLHCEDRASRFSCYLTIFLWSANLY